MSSEQLKNKSSEKLEGELRGIKIVAIALLITISMLFGLIIYGIAMKGMDTVYVSLLVVGIGCSAILPLQFSSMKKIKVELDSRN